VPERKLGFFVKIKPPAQITSNYLVSFNVIHWAELCAHTRHETFAKSSLWAGWAYKIGHFSKVSNFPLSQNYNI